MQPKTAIAVMFILLGLVAAILFFEIGPYDLKVSTNPDLEVPVDDPEVKEITIRNVTSEQVSYTIKPLYSKENPERKILGVAVVDRFPGEEDMIISFERSGENISYTLYSGMAYSFRHDENDKLELYRGAHGIIDVEDLAPFVPTPMDVVERMLVLAIVDRNDVVYDLGCGDGRIVITAARKYGARGVGIDINPQRIREAIAGAQQAGVENLVKFRLGDVMKEDFSEATVVALYLLTESNKLLRPLLEKQLKPGIMVVSHNYSIPGWEDKEIDFISFQAEDGEEHDIYLYKR